MTTGVPAERFDAFYFERGLGRPYARNDYWLQFFEAIADRIVSDIGPKTVLDAGCALGFLVEGLRKRRVEAYGVDVSEYAIANVDPSIKPYCWVGSVTEPFPTRYELIACIEVLEHLPREEADRAVANLCAHTDDILFSSSPHDFREATHLNVQAPEYWAALFARHSFFRDTEIEPFVTPWGVRFRRSVEPVGRVVAGYERRLWRLEQEARGSRELVLEQRAELASGEEQRRKLEREALASRELVQEQQAELASREEERRKLELEVRLSRDLQQTELEALQTWLSDVFFRAVAAPGERHGCTNVPLAARPTGPLLQIQREGHSLWCFRDGADSLWLDANLVAGTYYFNGRVVATREATLYVEFDSDSSHVLVQLAGAAKDFSTAVEVSQPVRGFRLVVDGAPSFVALGDFHVLRDDAPHDVRADAVARAGRNLARRVVKRLSRTPAETAASNEYEPWRERRLAFRGRLYADRGDAGVFSLLTSAWNTPVEYLNELAASVFAQDYSSFEWIVLDNGSTTNDTRQALETLAEHECVSLFRLDENIGIVGGMRHCFEHASGRYVLPLDSDDLLTPDCLSIIAWYLRYHNFPPLLYTDEDKVRDGRYEGAYLKPDWDPVLFFNSCYVAHLCAIDREVAGELDVYTDQRAEGSHDWDTFTRFFLAGQVPAHAPEVVYSWRMHPKSAALDIKSKPYVSGSHKSVLQKFLDAQHRPDRYRIEPSPLFEGTPDWWFRREHVDPRPYSTVVLVPASGVALLPARGQSEEVFRLRANFHADASLVVARREAARGGLVNFVVEGAELDSDEWLWEALTLLELHPDSAVVGGRAYDASGHIVAAGDYFGFGPACGCPDVGRALGDPGYFAQMWKQRSVDAVSSMLATVDGAFLADVLETIADEPVSLAFLGAWLGAEAASRGRRVVYSPFVSAQVPLSRVEWDGHSTPGEHERFARRYRELLSEPRFLSPLLSRDPQMPYQLSSPHVDPRSGRVAGPRVGA